MSTPEDTPEPSDLGATERERRDDLTRSVGVRLAATPDDAKPSWWKRLLGRS